MLQNEVELASHGTRRPRLDEGEVGGELRSAKGVVRQDAACLIGSAVRELGYRVAGKDREGGRPTGGQRAVIGEAPAVIDGGRHHAWIQHFDAPTTRTTERPTLSAKTRASTRQSLRSHDSNPLRIGEKVRAAGPGVRLIIFGMTAQGSV